ncbi:MAG: sialidase family protein, partial [Sporichthyaceae bacterium]
MHRSRLIGALAVVVLGLAPGVMAQTSANAVLSDSSDVLVSNGSLRGPFAANKQNEPAVAIDANNPTVLAAGSNEEIDMEACNAGTDNTCPFTDKVGVSGIYFSFDSGSTWTQPTYQGLTGRGCTGVPGDADPPCEAKPGPIGTLPNYAENNLVSDGDPALAFGPKPNGHGGFTYANGSRLYYANLTSGLSGAAAPFKGFEAIAVSHTDNPQAAAAGDEAAWSAPVIASKQNAALFSDKEQIWADNARSSAHFGNAYVCYSGFRSGPGASQPLFVLTSRDGGNTWVQKQVTPATNNTSSPQGFGRSGCTVRTDSRGVVYVFDYAFPFGAPGLGKIQMIKSFDGGSTWTRPRTVATAYDTCTEFEASIGRCVMDGVGGARSDLSASPSVDIANGAPLGTDATNRIVMSWVDGKKLNEEQVKFNFSDNGGTTWSDPASIQLAGHRGYYSAPAISPDGKEVWVVYNAWLEPFKTSAVGPTNDRPLVGVMLHADSSASGVGAFSLVHQGASGDARGSSQNNLAAEFLGDYVYAAASRTYGAAVWNDVRN